MQARDVRTTIQKSYYRNGQLREILPLQNRQRHGVVRTWHKNGRLSSEERYADGFLHGMPRERLERTVVLNEVRELDRQQRIREGVLKQINRNPDLKRAYDLLVKDLPEDQKENVIAQIARSTRRTIARTQGQQQTRGEAVTV